MKPMARTRSLTIRRRQKRRAMLHPRAKERTSGRRALRRRFGVDLDGLMQRAVPLPVPAAVVQGLDVRKGKVFFLTSPLPSSTASSQARRLRFMSSTWANARTPSSSRTWITTACPRTARKSCTRRTRIGSSLMPRCPVTAVRLARKRRKSRWTCRTCGCKSIQGGNGVKCSSLCGGLSATSSTTRK